MLKCVFSDAFSDREVLFNNYCLKHEALLMFLNTHVLNDHVNPLCVWDNIHVTQTSCLTLSSFFNQTRLLFGQGVETAQHLFNDILAFFMTTL